MKAWVKDLLIILTALAFFTVLGFTEWRMYRLGYADGYNEATEIYNEVIATKGD